MHALEAGVAIICQGTVTLPDIAHELGIATNSASAHSLHTVYTVLTVDRVITSKPVSQKWTQREPYPCMNPITSTPIMSTLIHPGQGSLASVLHPTLANTEFDE
jgi:hypothetical protein